MKTTLEIIAVSYIMAGINAEGNNRLHLNIEIDRKYTVSLQVEKDGPVNINSVLADIGRYDLSLIDETACIQQLTRNKFRWSFNCEYMVDQIIKATTERPLIIDGCPTQVMPASRQALAILYDTPYEFSEQKIRELLGNYGSISGVKRTTFRDFPRIYDGKVLVYYTRLDKALPEEIIFGNSGRIVVRQPGDGIRRKRCYKCGEIGAGHDAKDCPGVTLCFSCKQPGHKAFECSLRKNGNQEPQQHGLTASTPSANAPADIPSPPEISQINYAQSTGENEGNLDLQEQNGLIQEGQNLPLTPQGHESLELEQSSLASNKLEIVDSQDIPPNQEQNKITKNREPDSESNHSAFLNRYLRPQETGNLQLAGKRERSDGSLQKELLWSSDDSQPKPSYAAKANPPPSKMPKVVTTKTDTNNLRPESRMTVLTSPNRRAKASINAKAKASDPASITKARYDILGKFTNNDIEKMISRGNAKGQMDKIKDRTKKTNKI